MKGVILAGGSGTRLHPLTLAVNKACLPVHGEPLIYHSINKLTHVGITDILIVTNHESIGPISSCVGSGDKFGCKIHFTIQEKPQGLAHAVLMAENFVGNESFIVILGDNFFQDTLTAVKDALQSNGCVIATKTVENPCDYGVLEVNRDGSPKEIVEKPKNPKSNEAVVGIYGYDPTVFSVIKLLKPSKRGEIEITDLNMQLLKAGVLSVVGLKGNWIDIGSVEHYEKAIKTSLITFSPNHTLCVYEDSTFVF